MLAQVDFTRDGFPLHEHVIFDYAADRACTLSVPWSSFRFSAPAHATEAEARRAFNRAYLKLASATPAEMKALREAILAAGHVPLGELIKRQQQP